MASKLLLTVGSAVDRATLRLMSRAFQGRPREQAAELPRGRSLAEVFEVGRRFYSSAETRARLLAVLPFHGLRTPAAVRFSGALFPTANVFRTNEAFAHALADLRALIAWLRNRGTPEIGLMGMSLGGYLTALTASCEPELGFAI